MIEFTPLTKSDLPLVREWLEREHVRPWWRAFEKAGVRHVRDVEEESHGVRVPHRLLRLDRGAQET